MEVGMKETEQSAAEHRLFRMSGQLGNWTMVANAGGLAFVLTAARDTEIAAKYPLEIVYAAFLLGLVLGFVGHALLVAAEACDMDEMTQMSDKLRLRGIGAYLCAAVAAGIGLVLPLFFGAL
jgi:hypothetical protein